MKKPTFIEYIVIAAIVSIVVAILFPVFSKGRGGDIHRNCQSNLKQLGLALLEYAQDNDECLPAVSDRPGRVSWRTALRPYTKTDGELYFCPSRGLWEDAQNGPFASDGLPISYAANTAGAGRTGTGRGPFAPSAKPVSLDDIDDPKRTIAFCEVQKTASAGFDIDDPFFGPKRQVLYAGHLGMSNYLLFDSHVIGLHPVETAEYRVGRAKEPFNLWYGMAGRPLSPNGREILKRTAAAFPVPQTP
jgi:type II secretory pathway pseudopilin PulG